MPKVNGQGHSVATLAKQYALKKSLGAILGPVVALARRYHVPCVIADMTAGCGVDLWGRDGSPLIIAEHVKFLAERFGYPIQVLYAEHRKPSLEALRHVVSERYPEIAASYFRDQIETVAAIPAKAFGLAYFDPNGYNAKPGKPDGLDADLLAHLGQSRACVDILITRECLAGYRMQRAAHCPGTLTIQDYLALTGKKRQYILPYADYHWWALGFATNWTEHPVAKKHGWVDVHGPDGPAIYAKWTAGMELKTAEGDESQGELPW